jgi:hypothetical protein
VILTALSRSPTGAPSSNGPGPVEFATADGFDRVFALNARLADPSTRDVADAAAFVASTEARW